jgi:hypothetical protein
MTLLKWLFVPIVFFFSVGAASLVCIFLLNFLDSILSVVKAMIGMEPSNLLKSILASLSLCIGCIIGAAITVILPSFSAPKYQKETAHLALVFGAVMSGNVFLLIGKAIFLPAYIAALGAGIASVAYVGRVSRTTA